MPSVIASARQSGASVFDFVTTTANAANQLVSTGSRAIDALDRKTQVMHARVKAHTAASLVTVSDSEIMRAAIEHVDLLEDFHRQVYGNLDTFDRVAAVNESVSKITAAVETAVAS